MLKTSTAQVGYEDKTIDAFICYNILNKTLNLDHESRLKNIKKETFLSYNP